MGKWNNITLYVTAGRMYSGKHSKLSFSSLEHQMCANVIKSCCNNAFKRHGNQKQGLSLK